MAIGVIISSNNLSGKTASVTFQPSIGGTVDLGLNTIPFNYMSQSPYGIYSLYFSEYNHTYTLEVPAPTYTGQTMTGLVQLSNNNNWNFVVQDFNDLTATIIPTSIDYSNWTYNGSYVTLEKGYMHTFYSQSNEYVTLMTDYLGNIGLQYSSTTWCDLNSLDGFYNCIVDYEKGKMIYSYGDAYHTLDWDFLDYNNYEFSWDWDVVSKDGNFMFNITKSDNTNTKSFLCSNTGTTLLYEYNPSDYYMTVGFYHDGNFFYKYAYNTNTAKYETIELREAKTGNILQSIDLSNDNYDAHYTQFYGDNKITIALYNNSDPNVDYKIINYHGNTDDINIMSHNRGNYGEITMISDSNFWPDNTQSTQLYIFLYKYDGWDNKTGTVVSYCDILYTNSSDATMGTYVFQNSGLPNKSIDVWPLSSDVLFTSCDVGDGIWSVFSISESGTNLSPFIDKNLINGFNRHDFGSSVVYLLWDATYQQPYLCYIKPDGTIGDTMQLSLPSPYSYNAYDRYGTFAVNNNTTQYYINDTTTGFTEMNVYSNSYTSSSFYEPNVFTTTSEILFHNQNTNESQILSKNNLTPVNLLPENNGTYSISVGKDKFMYTYLDSVTNLLKIKLYDFNYNLLNSVDTNYTSYLQVSAVKDRYTVVAIDGNNYVYYLISDTTITTTVTTDQYNYILANDFIWWD